jgi:hypothetical protein
MHVRKDFFLSLRSNGRILVEEDNQWISLVENWPKCNHSIYDYMPLLVICNYIWTFLQLFLVLIIFATTLQLVCTYFSVHPSM